MNAARDLGKILSKRKIRSIVGSSDIGFIGCVTEIILTTRHGIVSNTYERLLDLSNCIDAFIALPGGFKTLEEIVTIVSWSQQNRYKKPISLLNVNNFYICCYFSWMAL